MPERTECSPPLQEHCNGEHEGGRGYSRVPQVLLCDCSGKHILIRFLGSDRIWNIQSSSWEIYCLIALVASQCR